MAPQATHRPEQRAEAAEPFTAVYETQRGIARIWVVKKGDLNTLKTLKARMQSILLARGYTPQESAKPTGMIYLAVGKKASGIQKRTVYVAGAVRRGDFYVVLVAAHSRLAEQSWKQVVEEGISQVREEMASLFTKADEPPSDVDFERLIAPEISAYAPPIWKKVLVFLIVACASILGAMAGLSCGWSMSGC